MQLTSLGYLVFLALVVLLLLVWPAERVRARQRLLLAACYAFYASWDLRFPVVLAAVTLFSFLVARALARAPDAARRRMLVGASAALLLAAIGVFRYVPSVAHRHAELLASWGIGADTVAGHWFIPIGLSFYSFIAIGYLVDCHRGRQAATADLLGFSLFIAFFPQLLSGPVARASHLLPQLQRLPRASASQVTDGIGLMLLGFAKKLLLADYLGAAFVSTAFDPTASASGPMLLAGLYAYTLQIYFDLSGYTDLARGAAKLLGVELAENFDAPYLARSVSEFWQRWHISMSSFFRDYLYFALGGARQGHVYLNLMVTFVAIGMWHGAGWNFALYGALHGALVCLERGLRTRGRRGWQGSVAGLALTFNFVVWSRVLFRAPDLAGATEYMGRLLSGKAWSVPWPAPGFAAWVFAAAAAGVFVPRVRGTVVTAYRASPVPVKAALIVGVTYLAVALSPTPGAFVYSRF